MGKGNRHKNRISKTLHGSLLDLDEHVFLLRNHLLGLKGGVAQTGDAAHFKAIAAELRVLACHSSGTEGLLWRLVDKIGVSDILELHCHGGVDKQNPLAENLEFCFAPIQRAGYGPPEIPAHRFRLRDVLKKLEAVYISGKSMTHEQIIKCVSQQMGSAHEADAIAPELARLEAIEVGGLKPHVALLAFDAELVLQIGERVLEKAECGHKYRRKDRHGSGDLSVLIRIGLRAPVKKPFLLFTMRSFISEASISCTAHANHLAFTLSKKGRQVRTVDAHFPVGWKTNHDAVFGLQYCSSKRSAHAITNDSPQDEGIAVDIGWIECGELNLIDLAPSEHGAVHKQWIMSFPKLVALRDCLKLLEAPVDALWQPIPESERGKVFPTY